MNTHLRDWLNRAKESSITERQIEHLKFDLRIFKESPYKLGPRNNEWNNLIEYGCYHLTVEMEVERIKDKNERKIGDEELV